MRCDEVKPWLLASKKLDELPQECQQHLRACRSCRTLWDRLARLQHQTCRLRSPNPSPEAKSQLFNRIAATTRTPNRLKELLKNRPLWISLAVCLLLFSGVCLGRWTKSSSSSAPVVAEKPDGKPTSSKQEHASILLRVVKNDLRLAETTAPEKQVAILGQMATDLKTEVMRLVRNSSLDSLPMIIDLYNYTITEGVMHHAAGITKHQHREQSQEVIRNLLRDEQEIVNLAQQPDTLPLVVELLQPMATTAKEAAQKLEENRQPLEPKVSNGNPGMTQPLLVALVYQGVRLAGEADSLRRAKLCSELVTLLTPTVVTLSANGDMEQADELGNYLGELWDRGVADHLDRAVKEDTNQTRRAEIEQVRIRSFHASTVLERNFALAPSQAKAGLQRALEASQKGRERAAPPGWAKAKGNHGSSTKSVEPSESDLSPGKGKSGIPPGWQKKGGKS